ncbi:ATP-dependent DNA ligase [Streptomyces sp. NPDC001732]
MIAAGWQEDLSEQERTALRAAARPRTVGPMLATLTKDYFSDPGWLFERKLDGERCLGFRDSDRARLASRSGEDLTDTCPEVAGALAGQGCNDFVVDGEMVAFIGTRTSFARLQQRMDIHDLAEVQVQPRAGTGDRRFHRAGGQPYRLRRAARRLLRG